MGSYKSFTSNPPKSPYFIKKITGGDADKGRKVRTLTFHSLSADTMSVYASDSQKLAVSGLFGMMVAVMKITGKNEITESEKTDDRCGGREAIWV